MPDKVRASSEFILWLKGYCQKNNLTSEKALDQILENVLRTSTPTDSTAPAPDLDHLNINQKNGVIQTYLRKAEGRLELRKERIAESQAKSDIRIAEAKEIAKARAEIEKEIENEKRFKKRYIQTGKPKVDWGDSEGVANPDWHEGYR